MATLTRVTIDDQVSQGHYASPSAVIDAGLRLLRDTAEIDKAEIDAINAAIIEGEESGEPQEIDFDEFLKELHRKHAR